MKVESPDPIYARMLQQAIGGIEGEIASACSTSSKVGVRAARRRSIATCSSTPQQRRWGILKCLRLLLLSILRTLLPRCRKLVCADTVVGAVMGGENPRHAVEGMLHKHLLSTGMAAFPAILTAHRLTCRTSMRAATLLRTCTCNVAAETTGRVLAVRLRNATNDPGMLDMWSFLIARDTMHQQQWLAVIEELGGHEAICRSPNSFPQARRARSTATASSSPRRMDRLACGSLTSGPSLDGKGEFSVVAERTDGRGASPRPSTPRQRRTVSANRLELSAGASGES